MNIPLIGGHVSAAGGLHKSIENAERIGARCIQIFGASPRQWHARMPSDEEARAFKEARSNSNIERVYLHAAYLVNLASPEQAIREKSIKSLESHLRIAELIAAEGLIFHIGSGKEAPKGIALENVIQALRLVLDRVPGHAELVMENSAGGGQKLGSTIAELGMILKAVASPRLKLCFDTAHAFEAGIIEQYDPAHIDAFFDEFEKECGPASLVALHVNDSKTAYNSHHDRHENIGEGHIGLAGFKNLAREKRLYDKAWLLEVPGFDGTGPDQKNIEILKSCFHR